VPAGAQFICPMDPEVRQDRPGWCPKCGMSLEPDLSDPTALLKVEYTCPMALEPRTVGLDERPNPEMIDMTRRFKVGAFLALPVFLLAMGDMVFGAGLGGRIDLRVTNWLGLFLATPVVWWAGWPFFLRRHEAPRTLVQQ